MQSDTKLLQKTYCLIVICFELCALAYSYNVKGAAEWWRGFYICVCVLKGRKKRKIVERA